MTEEITDRIRQLMQEYNLSPSAFADEIGIQRPAISHILSGRNRPSLDVVMKILKAFDQINPQWLLTGEGTMKQLNLFEDPSEETNKTIDNKVVTKETPLESRVENQPVSSSDTAHSQPVYSQPDSIPVLPQEPPVSESRRRDDVQSFRQTPPSPPSFYHNPPPSSPELAREPDHSYSSTPPYGHYEYPREQYKHRHVQYEQSAPHEAIKTNDNKEIIKDSTITDTLFGNSEGKKIERIVMFFADKTFAIYTPE